MTQARILLQAEDKLRHRVEFETLIANISTHFLNLDSADIEAGINHTLEIIATFVEADRSYVFLVSEDETQADNAYEWCAEGIDSQRQRLQHVSGEEFAWFAEKIRRLEVIHIARVADFPPEASAEKIGFESQGIQSLLVVPMAAKGELIGFLGFDAVKAEKTWKEEDIILLKTAGNIFANALTHKHAEEALRESEQRYSGIFNTTTDAFLLIDAAGKILDVNVRACTMYGFCSEELLARNITELVTTDYQNYLLNQIRHSIQTTTKLSLEAINIRQDGSHFYVEIQGGPYTWRGQSHFLAAIRDISERKQAEAQLRIYHDRLEELVEERTAELIETNTQLIKEIAERKRAEKELAGYQAHLESLVEKRTIELKKANEALAEKNEQLQAANASKDRFFSILSHDLRTPFIGLLGFTQILTEEFENYPKEKLKSLLVKLSKTAETFYTLLENLLTWSRSQLGVIEFQPHVLNIRENILRNLRIFDSAAQEKRIRLLMSINEPIPVYADEKMIDTVFRNLLSNALKFTHPGGQVTIAAIQDGQTATITITDTGIGIGAVHLPKLFRIDTSYKRKGTANEQGTGLGLILCKEFIEKNGGTIGVESEIGKGSTFTCTLPQKST